MYFRLKFSTGLGVNALVTIATRQGFDSLQEEQRLYILYSRLIRPAHTFRCTECIYRHSIDRSIFTCGELHICVVNNVHQNYDNVHQT